MAPQESTDIATKPTFNEMFGEVSTLLDCLTKSLNEYFAVDDVSIEPILADKEILNNSWTVWH